MSYVGMSSSRALFATLLLMVSARADTIVRYAVDVPHLPSSSSWTDESESEGNPGCSSCPCNSTQIPYSFNPGPDLAPDKTYLEAVDFGSVEVPAGHVVTRVNVDVMCRYNDGTTGRIRVIPEVQGVDLGFIDSESFVSDTECKYRLGNLGDITAGLPAWDKAALDTLKVRVRRAGTNDTILRVRAFRLTVETTFMQVANDECPGLAIQGAATWFDLTGATPSGSVGPGDCFDPELSDVWFHYFATETGTVTFSTCGSPADTLIAVYDGACGMSFNDCDDDASCDEDDLAASLELNVTAGGAYVVRIGSYDGPVAGVLQTAFASLPPVPVNDECSGALPIGDGGFPFDTQDATTSPGSDLGECSEIVKDVWFRYDAPCDGDAIFLTCGTGESDTILAVYGGQCSSPTLLGCSDDSEFCDDVRSLVIVPVAAGHEYWVRVGGYSGAVDGALLASCSNASPPWTDLGSGLAGSAGTPHLSGVGALIPGGSITLSLSSAKPSAPGLLLVANASIPKPFKGGTVLANPALLSLVVLTNGLGAVDLALPVPADVVSGVAYYFQCAIRDGAAIQGVALSNAISTFAP